MREKRYTFSQVFDIYGVRVLVADTDRAATPRSACCTSLYKPIPGKFKDYIAIPKANGYQSLHTTLFGPFGTPLEAQIRTHDMHRIAEAGVAAHWLYKSGGELDLAEAQRETHRWLQSLLEIQSRVARLEGVPREHQGRPLPRRDLRVHAEGQDHGAAARRDRGRLRLRRAHRHRPPLRRRAHQLRAAAAAHRAEERRPRRDPDLADRAAQSVVAVVRRAPARRARASATSSRACSRRSRRRWASGCSSQALATLKVAPEAITLGPLGGAARRSTARKSQLEILADIGLGKRLSFVVAQALTRAAGQGRRRGRGRRGDRRSRRALTLRGVEGVAIQYAKCCRPIPGDAVVGQFRKGQGLARAHPRLRHAARSSASTPSSWSTSSGRPTSQGVFDAGIRLLVADRRGLLADLAHRDRRRRREHRQRVDGAARRRRGASRCSSACRCGPPPSRARDARAEARRRRAAGPARADLGAAASAPARHRLTRTARAPASR